MPELPTQRDFDDFSAWTGRDVLTPDGERLGAVETIFLDEATDAPEWVLVTLGEADGSALVPLAGASVADDSIRVEQDRERIAGAPRLEIEDTITVAECRQLYEHYGLAHSQEESPTVLPEGAGAPAADEERPRLRKYVGAPVAAPDDGTDAQAEKDDADAAVPATGDGTDAQAERADKDETAAAVTPAGDDADAQDEPAEKDDAASTPTTKATGPVTPGPDATAPPTPIAPPTPRPIPPEGGFQAHAEEQAGGPLAVIKRRPALPITLMGGIAALIALLVFRKRR